MGVCLEKDKLTTNVSQQINHIYLIIISFYSSIIDR